MCILNLSGTVSVYFFIPSLLTIYFPLLIFCIDPLPIAASEVLTYKIITELLIYPFNFFSCCHMNFKGLLLDANYVYNCYVFLVDWCSYQYKIVFVSYKDKLCKKFVLKSSSFYINIATPIILWLLLLYCEFCHSFTFNLFVSTNLKCVSCTIIQLNFIFLIQGNNIFILIVFFKTFTFNDIIYIVAYISANLSCVNCMSHVFFFLFSSFTTLFCNKWLCSTFYLNLLNYL